MSTENVPGKQTQCERGRSGIEETKAGIVWPSFLHEKQPQRERTIGRLEEQKRTGAPLIMPMTTLDSNPTQTALGSMASDDAFMPVSPEI